MTWNRRLAVVLTGVLFFLAVGVTAAVVRGWYGGDCWPWETRQDVAGATLCDGERHPHSRG